MQTGYSDLSFIASTDNLLMLLQALKKILRFVFTLFFCWPAAEHQWGFCCHARLCCISAWHHKNAGHSLLINTLPLPGNILKPKQFYNMLKCLIGHKWVTQQLIIVAIQLIKKYSHPQSGQEYFNYEHNTIVLSQIL